jgi:hypothetical protein
MLFIEIPKYVDMNVIHFEFCQLGVKFSVRPSILLKSRECSPLGVNEVVNIPPREQISPLWRKFLHPLLHNCY